MDRHLPGLDEYLTKEPESCDLEDYDSDTCKDCWSQEDCEIFSNYLNEMGGKE